MFDLQHQLPLCRILYSSATAISRPKAIAPFVRLGLWRSHDGSPASDIPSSIPFNSFKEFNDTIIGQKSTDLSHSALARMELIARELHTSGLSASRTLALTGAGFHVEHVIPPDRLLLEYDQLVHVWTKMVVFMHDTEKNLRKFAATLPGGGDDYARCSKSIKVLKMQFWGAHQKVFKAMMVATKISHLIKRAKEIYANNGCAVIALWSTGQAGKKKKKN